MTQVSMDKVDVSELNLVQRLAKVRAIADVASKGKQGYNYTYVDVSEILANVSSGMKTYRVSLIPKIIPQTLSVTQNTTHKVRFSKKGDQYDDVITEMLVTGEIVYRWVNDDDVSDYMDIPWVIVGAQSDPSQALGTSLTYAMRQFLCNFFQIAQIEYDVDDYRKKQREAEDRENKLVLDKLIEQIDTKVKEIVGKDPNIRKSMAKFLTKYCTNSDYTKIKDLRVASKLLTDLGTSADDIKASASSEGGAEKKKAAPAKKAVQSEMDEKED